jgi:hypothetical protein
MDLFAKLFGRKRPTVNVTTLDLNGLLRLVSEYGAVVEEQSQTGSVVYDESTLPVPKEDMRKALLMLIASVKDEERREQLKAGYLALADFQAGVGSRTIKIDPLDPADDLQASAAKVAMQAEEVGRWQQLSIAETARLMQDLAALEGIQT